MEANLPSFRLRLRRRIKEVHDTLENLDDGGLVQVQTAFQFLLQIGQLAGELPVV